MEYLIQLWKKAHSFRITFDNHTLQILSIVNLDELDLDLPSLNQEHLEDDLNQGQREFSLASDFKGFASSEPATPSHQTESSEGTPTAQRFQTADPFERLNSPTEDDFDFILEKSPLKKKTVPKVTQPEFVFTTERFEPSTTEQVRTEPNPSAMATFNPRPAAGPGPMEDNQHSDQELGQQPVGKSMQQVKAEEMAEYNHLWQDLKSQYLKWERGRTMVSNKIKRKMLLKSLALDGRKAWKALEKNHDVEEEDFIREMKGWMVNEAQQPKTATRQQLNSRQNSHQNRSPHFYNHNRATSSSNDFQAFFRAQVEAGKALGPLNPPSHQGKFWKNYKGRGNRWKKN